MTKPLLTLAAAAFVLAVAGNSLPAGAAGTVRALPPAAIDVPKGKAGELQTAVFAGGCFWGVEAVFRHVNGVASAVSGYSGGAGGKTSYEAVSSGMTGHAESVEVTFDPSQVSYGRLLQVFFSVAHDPTQLNRQGPDHGTQYRSAIFYATLEQRDVARAYVEQLTRENAFGQPIVTEIKALRGFQPAEDYHQNYVALHPNQPYIVVNDLPKLARLREQFPQIYVAAR